MNHKRASLGEELAKHKKVWVKRMENRGNSKATKILTVTVMYLYYQSLVI